MLDLVCLLEKKRDVDPASDLEARLTGLFLKTKSLGASFRRKSLYILLMLKF